MSSAIDIGDVGRGIGAGTSVDIGDAEVKLRWTVPTDKGDVQVEYAATGLPKIHPLEPGILRFNCPQQISGGP